MTPLGNSQDNFVLFLTTFYVGRVGILAALVPQHSGSIICRTIYLSDNIDIKKQGRYSLPLFKF